MSYQKGILKLDSAWQPVDIIPFTRAAKYYEKDKILTELGESYKVLNGGVNRYTGEVSQLDMKSIIVVKGKSFIGNAYKVPAVYNDLLFKRDNYTCAYCMKVYNKDKLSCDHIVPRHQKGPNTWMNVITACKVCNFKKANKTPEQAGMLLGFGPKSISYIDVLLYKMNLTESQREFLTNLKKR